METDEVGEWSQKAFCPILHSKNTNGSPTELSTRSSIVRTPTVHLQSFLPDPAYKNTNSSPTELSARSSIVRTPTVHLQSFLRPVDGLADRQAHVTGEEGSVLKEVEMEGISGDWELRIS
ncbi:hypothetical protein RRG08_067223 [Elysia crispata]|uniref:Uncharacterized protein n=1 Tax=Elysia crispata TaxID=231223 RepID=A0AAE1DVQ5_9GAST|nr:hypothetical protein RRG08_067223 [Elysia crispata]